MIDYIIVGSGLAGIAFAETILQKGKTCIVFDNKSQNSSTIAGGLYNPVILKRFSEVWQAQEQLVVLDRFYAVIEKKLGVQVDFKRPILRKFFSVEEQNNWFAASDKVNLAPFLSLDLVSKKYSGIESPFGYGQVLHTGYVDTAVLLEHYQAYLSKNQWLLVETFDYNQVVVTSDCIQYGTHRAKHIVFAEGFGIHSNPFFTDLPLDGTKGELFIIKAPALNLDVIVNTSVFILPLGNDLFKVGATYNWKDKTADTTPEGRAELIERISEILNCEFEIVHHFAGVRPTVKDRRPLLGTHFLHNNMHLLNGMGTRGVMLAPAMAEILFDAIENEIPLPAEIDIQRFYKKR